MDSMKSLDSSTRRAFPLDSRTVWVEQQIRHQVLLPKDNLPIGPAEYAPKLFERHVSTPVLGKYRGPADHFRGFHSSLSLSTPGQRSGLSRSPERSVERKESVTIFHNHDQRDPLDPKLRFDPTPDPYLSHNSALSSKDVFGIHQVKDTLPFGPDDVPFGERNPIKKALPTYEVNYDSRQIRPNPKLTSFSKSKRIYIPKKGEKPFPGSHDEDDAADQGRSRSQSPIMGRRGMSGSRSRSPLNQSQSLENMSVFQMRCNLVVLPKLKTRRPPELRFNAASYRKDKRKMPILLTPKVVKEKAKVNLFKNILTIPRPHKSAAFN